MFVTFITIIVVMVAQLWALSRYSCVYLGSLHPRNFIYICVTVRTSQILSSSHKTWGSRLVCMSSMESITTICNVCVDWVLYIWNELLWFQTNMFCRSSSYFELRKKVFSIRSRKLISLKTKAIEDFYFSGQNIPSNRLH